MLHNPSTSHQDAACPSHPPKSASIFFSFTMLFPSGRFFPTFFFSTTWKEKLSSWKESKLIGFYDIHPLPPFPPPPSLFFSKLNPLFPLCIIISSFSFLHLLLALVSTYHYPLFLFPCLDVPRYRHIQPRFDVPYHHIFSISSSTPSAQSQPLVRIPRPLPLQTKNKKRKLYEPICIAFAPSSSLSLLVYTVFFLVLRMYFSRSFFTDIHIIEILVVTRFELAQALPNPIPTNTTKHFLRVVLLAS